MTDLQEQLDDIRTLIEHHQATINTCQAKVLDLRAIIKRTREQVKALKEKRRKLILGSVGIKV